MKLFCGTMLLGHIIAVQQVPLGSVYAEAFVQGCNDSTVGFSC